MRRWTSLVSFLLVLLLAGAADGLMEALGPDGFMAVGLAVLALAWALSNFTERNHQNGAYGTDGAGARLY